MWMCLLLLFFFHTLRRQHFTEKNSSRKSLIPHRGSFLREDLFASSIPQWRPDPTLNHHHHHWISSFSSKFVKGNHCEHSSRIIKLVKMIHCDFNPHRNAFSKNTNKKNKQWKWGQGWYVYERETPMRENYINWFNYWNFWKDPSWTYELLFRLFELSETRETSSKVC